METDKLLEHIDQHRWLLNNGLITDGVKNQLFTFGSIVHQNIQAVDLDIDVEKKLVKYRLYTDEKLIKKIALYNELSKATGIVGMWRFKRLLKKEGPLDLKHVLGRFVHDYCGPKWIVEVDIVHIKDYVEGFGEKGEPQQSQQPDKAVDR